MPKPTDRYQVWEGTTAHIDGHMFMQLINTPASECARDCRLWRCIVRCLDGFCALAGEQVAVELEEWMHSAEFTEASRQAFGQCTDDIHDACWHGWYQQ
jgi:hypothetical protein